MLITYSCIEVVDEQITGTSNVEKILQQSVSAFKPVENLNVDGQKPMRAVWYKNFP
jgi:hypothetical protein